MKNLIISIILLVSPLQARDILADNAHQEYLFLGDDGCLQEDRDKNTRRFLNLSLDEIVLKNSSFLEKKNELDGAELWKIIVGRGLFFEMKGEIWSGVLTPYNLMLSLSDRKKKTEVKLKDSHPKEWGANRFQHMFLSEDGNIYGVLNYQKTLIDSCARYEVFIVIDSRIYSGFAILNK